jgi:antitoxin HicB
MKYPALFEPAEEGGFVVTFPDVESAITQGEDEQDAREMARDALITMFGYYIRHGKPINPPSQPRGKKYRMIELPAVVALKTELYIAFRASGIRKTELARRMGIPKTTVDRLFDFENHTRLDQIEAAFAALGKRLRIAVEDTAYAPAA